MPSLSPSRFRIAILSVVLSAACSGDDGTSPVPADDVPLQGEVLFERPAMNEPGWFKDNKDRRNSEGDDWRTESLHDLAKPRLVEFWHRLVAGGQGKEGEEFLAADFAGKPLRGSKLQVVFEQGKTTVWRGAAAGEPVGRDRVDALSADLRAPFDAGSEPHPHGKIVTVTERGPDAFETLAVLHVEGHGKGGQLQQNASLLVTWRVLGDDESVEMTAIEALFFEEVLVAGPLFDEVTGAIFEPTHEFRTEMLRGVPEYHHRTDFMIGNSFVGMQGVAVGDVDGDGRDDVYVPQQSGLPNRLYLHRADGRAEDVTIGSGVGFLEETRSALIVDLDDDGDQDMAISIGAAVVLARNNGQARFPDLDALATGGEAEVYSMCMADPDRDGDLDLYGCRYSTRDSLTGVPIPYHDATNGAPNVYFRNDGPGGFTDATVATGFDQNNFRFSYAAIWEDLDDDGVLELYVANDFGRNNLFKADERGRYTDVAARAGAEDKSSGMGVSVADYDLDGDLDLFVTNMFSSAGNRIVPQYRYRGEERAEVESDYLAFARGNSLLSSNGDGTYTDVTVKARMAIGGWAWGAMFVDLNNDGYQDLYSPDGYITNQDPDDT